MVLNLLEFSKFLRPGHTDLAAVRGFLVLTLYRELFLQAWRFILKWFILESMSFLRSKGNHLKDCLDKGTWTATIGKCERSPKTPFMESIFAAQDIYRYHKDLILCLSGGVDSEAMALAFMAARVPFKVAIMRFPNDWNQFDIKHAISFCEDHKLEYQFYDFNVFRFLGSRQHKRIAYKYQCISPQLCCHIAFISKLSGTPVLAWNSPPILKINGRREICLPNYQYFSYMRFFEISRRPGIPFFFAYSPELVYSFIRLPAFQKFFERLLKSPGDYHQDYRDKCSLYRVGGFGITPKPEKLTGFELVKLYYDKKTGVECSFDRFYRKPFQEKIRTPREVIYLREWTGMGVQVF